MLSTRTRSSNSSNATKSIKHGEVDLRLGNEVDILEEASDLLNTRLTFSKVKLEDFKSIFPA